MDFPETDSDVEMKVLGLEVTAGSDEEVGVPLEAMAVIKVLANDQIEYRMVSTVGLTSVEAMGMIQWADLNVKAVWSAPVIIVDNDEDDGEGAPA